MACTLALCSMLAACSTKDDKKDNKTENKVENKANTAKDHAEDSIDNMMSYFKEKGVAYDQSENIDQMDFAAYEGRSFMANNNRVYLYRVKSEDENMKKILKEAADKGKVKVRINNKESEYNAKVNGDYLLLYDTNADITDVLGAFPGYRAGTTTTTTSTDESDQNTNPSNTDGNNQTPDANNESSHNNQTNED